MVVDLSHLPPDLVMQIDRGLREEFNQELFRATKRQEQIAAWYYRNQSRPVAGLEQTMALDPFFDRCLRRAYGQDVFEDKDRMNWLKKRHPEIKVKTSASKTSILVPAQYGIGRLATWKKSYT